MNGEGHGMLYSPTHTLIKYHHLSTHLFSTLLLTLEGRWGKRCPSFDGIWGSPCVFVVDIGQIVLFWSWGELRCKCKRPTAGYDAEAFISRVGQTGDREGWFDLGAGYRQPGFDVGFELIGGKQAENRIQRGSKRISKLELHHWLDANAARYILQIIWDFSSQSDIYPIVFFRHVNMNSTIPMFLKIQPRTLLYEYKFGSYSLCLRGRSLCL